MQIYSLEDNPKITDSTLLLRLKRDDSERPLSFQPGQYAAISYEKKNKKSAFRCFSIVSSPTDQDHLEFSMRVRGAFTTKLSKLSPGTIFNVRGPFGGFFYDNLKDKKALFIAGGIGITPFISMMRYAATLQNNNEITLLYSAQNQDDIPFKDELLAIHKEHPNLKPIFVISKGDTDKLPVENVKTGYIDDNLLKQYVDKNIKEVKYFICGPPGFMKMMSANLIKQAVPKDLILTEAFTQSSPKQSSILRSWPANVYTIGAIGLVLGSLIIMVSDLLRILPPKNSDQPTKNSNFYITNARQKTLDNLVNTIPPSPTVINAPTANQQATQGTTTPTTNSAPPTFAPIYLAAPAAPKTTASVPPP